MAKVTYIDPIKSISGKLSKKHFTILNVRTAPTNNPDMIANPNYTVYRDPNKKIKSTSAQTVWKEKFGLICRLTTARLVDASKLTQDRLAYAKQDKYKTLRSFVWNLVKEEQMG